MIRVVIGVLFLLVALLDAVGALMAPRHSPDFEMLTIFLIVFGALGGGLLWWGLRAVRAKRLARALAIVFEKAGKAKASLAEVSTPSAAPEALPADTGTGPVAYGVHLSEGEEVVANLIPENTERLYYHRGQVAGVTQQRLLFVLPRRAIASKALDKYYSIESILLSDVREVSHKKSIALGGMVVGLILIGLAIFVAYAGVTGQIIGPGVVFIPLVAVSAGFSLALGVRRRVITFSTIFGYLCWQSGPLEVKKTGVAASSIRELFDARQVPAHGFDEPPLAGRATCRSNG